MIELFKRLFYDRNASPCIVGQRRNIRLRGNAGLFIVQAISAQDGAAYAQFHEPLSGEPCADKGEEFLCFAIASKYTCKITSFFDRFSRGQNDSDYFT